MDLDLLNAVRTASAIRFDVALQPPGGPIQKVFPPTYPSPREARGDKRAGYAREKRLIDGEEVEAALLDSVPSQANRLEQALLDAHRRKENSVPLPLFEVSIEGYGIVTSLDAPHRVYDAILLDSLLDHQPFLKSALGSRLGAATADNATDLFTYAPTTLIFGAWNSHAGQRVGMATFPRAHLGDHRLARPTRRQDGEPHRSARHHEGCRRGDVRDGRRSVDVRSRACAGGEEQASIGETLRNGPWQCCAFA